MSDKLRLDSDRFRDRHGTVALYTVGCRCDECRAGMSAYGKAYRARKKAEGVAAREETVT